jgi:glycosyltransferase involved in cell wall biosynthesis
VQPYVSVIIPTLNRREMLASQVKTFRDQTYPADRFEVLIVDNGSEDGTEAWACAVEPTLPFRFRFLKNLSEFRVPAKSRNIGWAQSAGEIIAFTDSDCLPSPDWIAEGVSALLKDPGAGLAQGMTRSREDDGTVPAIHHTVQVLSSKSYYETCNIFYRREAIERVSGFHRDFIEGYAYPYFGEDTDLAYRVLEAGFGGVFVPLALVYHLVIPRSFRSWLKEPIYAFSLPFLVKKHPRIRKDLFVWRFFFTRMTALFDLALVGLILAVFVSPAALVLTAPFFIAKYQEGGSQLSVPMRLVRVAGASVRAVVVFGVLLTGSIYFRTLVI